MKYPVLWEEKWDFFIDIAVKYWSNRKSFMSEKMNDASSIGEKWFKSIRTQSVEEIEDHIFLKTMLCVDPAGDNSSNKKKKTDSFAMIVGSLGENDFKYIRRMVLEKMSFTEYCNTIIDILLEFTDITHISIERNTYLGSDVTTIQQMIEKIPELKKRNLIFINDMNNKNKDNRIATIQDPVNNGQIIFADNNKAFTDQILDFQGTAYTLHDDAADVVSDFANKILKIKTKNIIRFMDRRRLGV